MSAKRLTAHGIRPRAVQMQFIDALHESAAVSNSVSFIHADTGIGKSLGMLSVALDWMEAGYRVIIATHTHKLIRQLAQVELPLIAPTVVPGIYYGLSNYPSRARIEYLLAIESYDMETTRYLDMLSRYVGAIEDFIDEYGPLPDGVMANQLSCMHGDDNEEVMLERQLALSKKLVITTHSSVIHDGLYSQKVFTVNDKTVFLIDEGDAFIDQVENNRFQILSIREVVNYLQEHGGKKSLAALRGIVEEMSSIAGEKRTARHAELAREFFNEVKALSKGRAKWQEEFRLRFQSFLGYYPEVGLNASKVRKYPQIVISRPYVNKKIGDYLCKAHHAVLVSGTLSIKNSPDGMDWAIASLRVDDAVGIKAQFSPDAFGTLTFHLAGADPAYPPVYVGQGELSQRWLSRVVSDIRTLGRGENIVVLTGSHRESESIEKLLLEKNYSKPISRHRAGESIKDAATRFLAEGGVFITAAGHTGLNLVDKEGGLAFQSLFITRIGMAPKDDEKAHFIANMQAELSGEKDVARLKASLLRYEYSRNVVRSVRRIRQAIGRAIRSESHQASIVICDPRFPLYENRDTRLAMLREAIPTRFKSAYQAASKGQEKLEEVLF
ncbi:helicase C-terminal domain-containing protein [Rheinheimera sp.]|uniref:helicase C-terminal domain-containing protein n=1 Tax=Rheinheimera sp. TaxID=1869214 RepID=UPI004047256C